MACVNNSERANAVNATPLQSERHERQTNNWRGKKWNNNKKAVPEMYPAERCKISEEKNCRITPAPLFETRAGLFRTQSFVRKLGENSGARVARRNERKTTRHIIHGILPTSCEGNVPLPEARGFYGTNARPWM